MSVRPYIRWHWHRRSFDRFPCGNTAWNGFIPRFLWRTHVTTAPRWRSIILSTRHANLLARTGGATAISWVRGAKIGAPSKPPFWGPWGFREIQLRCRGLAFMRSSPQPVLRATNSKRKRRGCLFAGLAAHSIVPLEKWGTSAIGLVLAAVAHVYGWPIPKGGSQRIADALASYLRFSGRRDSVRRSCDVHSRSALRAHDLLRPNAPRTPRVSVRRFCQHIIRRPCEDISMVPAYSKSIGRFRIPSHGKQRNARWPVQFTSVLPSKK